jgi:hypothetical protein
MAYDPEPGEHIVEFPVMVPAGPAPRLIEIGKLAEAAPLPQALDGVTFNVPAVADAEKVAVIEAVFPDGEKPVPV